jgi:hypothetical protein
MDFSIKYEMLPGACYLRDVQTSYYEKNCLIVLTRYVFRVLRRIIEERSSICISL